MKRQGSLISSLIAADQCREHALKSTFQRGCYFGSAGKLRFKCEICGQLMEEILPMHVKNHGFATVKEFKAAGKLTDLRKKVLHDKNPFEVVQ